MPIYEYRCRGCDRVSSIFQRSVTRAVTPACQHCGGSDVTRIMSTFAVHRSVNDLYEDTFDDAALEGMDESDPGAMRDWARRMGDSMGEDFGSDLDSGASSGFGGDDFGDDL